MKNITSFRIIVNIMGILTAIGMLIKNPSGPEYITILLLWICIMLGNMSELIDKSP